MKRRSAARAAVSHHVAASLKSLTTLNSAVITTSLTEAADSVFGTSVTVSLLSREDAVAFASTVVLASLSPEGPTMPFSRRSTADKLAFYQSLILQFSYVRRDSPERRQTS